MLMREEIALLSKAINEPSTGSVLFIRLKSSPFGRISERIALPTVVSTRFNSESLFASLTFIFAWRSTFPVS